MRTFNGFKKAGSDNHIEDRIEELCKKFNISALDAVKLFPVLIRRQWLKRFLAHAELFKKTLEVPGDIAELGVFRGLGLMTWANLLESYCVGDRTKVVYGFDNWEGFTSLDPEDGKEAGDVQKFAGGFSPKNYYDELVEAISIFDEDRFVSWKTRIKLIRGNIEETIITFVKENLGVKFSLVHFDCDMYRPTKASLEALWPRLSRGGVMLFDEYSIQEWAGETKAVDEFFFDKPKIKIHKFSWTNAPAGYLVKNGV